jgi:hypothetical protein
MSDMQALAQKDKSILSLIPGSGLLPASTGSDICFTSSSSVGIKAAAPFEDTAAYLHPGCDPNRVSHFRASG